MATHWTQRNGKEVAISGMTDLHLTNTIKMLIRNESTYLPEYSSLCAEARKRKWRSRR